MPVITLTTEWRPDDIYFGIIRGKLSSLSPGTEVIENARGIPPFNISHASFIIRNTFSNYPEGSVHIICVHSEPENDKGYLALRSRGHFFIGTDNGIFNLILNTEAEEIIKIGNGDSGDELDIFARAAAHLAAGKELGKLGTTLNEVSERVPLRATIDKNVITGSVIFIDSYGNAISNITREVFNRVFENADFRIFIQSNKNHTGEIVKKYNDVPVGELLARFNSLDLLEIAINGADVSELLSLSVGSVIRIDSLVKTISPDRLF